jgi:hypothetical protein
LDEPIRLAQYKKAVSIAEAIGLCIVPEGLDITLLPMVRLPQNPNAKSHPRWYTSHASLTNATLETQRQQAQHDLRSQTSDSRPTRQISRCAALNACWPSNEDVSDYNGFIIHLVRLVETLRGGKPVIYLLQNRLTHRSKYLSSLNETSRLSVLLHSLNRLQQLDQAVMVDAR